MLPNESGNEMYSRLNIIVEEVNGLGLTQLQPSDVMRKILCVLPIDKYGHIVTMLHQGDLSKATPTQILGKINAHEIYMHITPQDGSPSSNKKKDLTFKASQERKGKAKFEASFDSSSEEVDDTNIALMVRRTTKMLKKSNRNGVKFDSKKKKFFTSSKRKPISKMDCYNYGEHGHLAHQCPKPKKDKFKKKYKDNKDDLSDDEKKREKPYKKKDGKKKQYHKKKNGKTYIVGDWLMDIESSSGSSGEDSDDEKERVAALVIGSSLPPPSPPPSSSTHLCLMAKGDQKVQSDDDSSDSDSDNEFVALSYDELVELLNSYTKIIRKTRAKNDKLELEKESLLAKYEMT
jgi:hypothetical protein